MAICAVHTNAIVHSGHSVSYLWMAHTWRKMGMNALTIASRTDIILLAGMWLAWMYGCSTAWAPSQRLRMDFRDPAGQRVEG